MLCEEAESSNSKVLPKNAKNVQLVRSDNLIALKVKRENIKAIQKAEKI